jgi:1-acyl-sn-glycerol-3-phosphate acyltransferase
VIPARRSAPILRFFDGYVRRYIGRRFHRCLLWGDEATLRFPRERPLLFVMSHASWWDVLVAYYLHREVVRVEGYAPMDEAQLRRYRILTRIGIYSVDRGTAAGMRAFLQYTTGLLQPGRAVWITPQGEIGWNWRRPVRFQPGVGHLMRRVPQLAAVPVAIAYEFMEEPRPEIFVRFGPARVFEDAGQSAAAITGVLEKDLERELDALQAAISERRLDGFRVLIAGATSASLVYDRVRAIRAWASGRGDPRRHGDVVSDPRRGGS